MSGLSGGVCHHFILCWEKNSLAARDVCLGSLSCMKRCAHGSLCAWVLRINARSHPSMRGLTHAHGVRMGAIVHLRAQQSMVIKSIRSMYNLRRWNISWLWLWLLYCVYWSRRNPLSRPHWSANWCKNTVSQSWLHPQLECLHDQFTVWHWTWAMRREAEG